MMALSDVAAAKVNLSLHAGPPKENGRHDLLSLVTFSGGEAVDTLTAEPATAVDQFSLTVDGPFAKQCGIDRDNLVVRAARAMDESLDGGAPRLEFRLHKALPCAAGVGGGSADAAAALRMVVRAHGKETSLDIAKAVAPTLGGDVLACLVGLPGLMSGEGECYEPLPVIPSLPALLVHPGVPCSTGKVFAAYDKTCPGPLTEHPVAGPSCARHSDFVQWLANMTCNDLQAVAIGMVPEIQTVLTILSEQPACRLARMSGSGATCFGLFDTMEQAEAAANNIRCAEPGWWVKPTLLRGGQSCQP